MLLAAVVAAASPAWSQAPAPPPAAAPTPAPPPPSEADLARARAVFDAGAKSFEAGDYDAAIQAFQQAYRVVPRDNLVFSIAQAHRRQYIATGQAKNLRAAVDHYRRYLARVATGGKRPDAVKALEELDAAYRALPQEDGADGAAEPPTSGKTRIWISSRTPGATFTIDGGEPAPVGRSVEVEPGKHQVRFTAPGHIEREIEVNAVAGELVPESLDLQPRPAGLIIRADSGAQVYVDGTLVGETPLPDAVRVAPGRHDVSISLLGHRSEATQVTIAGGETKSVEVDLVTTGQRDVAYGFLVTGGTFLTASGVFFAVAGARHGDAALIYQKHLDQNISVDDVEEYERIGAQRDRFAVAASATGVVGLIVGLVGAGLYLFDDATPITPARDSTDRDRPAAPALSPQLELSREGAAGALRGTF